jgi:hypothetical protein
MSAPYDVVAVRHLGGFRLRITFADGLSGDIDMASSLMPPVGPMFVPLCDEAFFAQVRVDEELGTVVWPNGADLAPDVLHDQITPV